MSKIGAIGKAIIDHYPSGFFSLDQIVEVTNLSRKCISDTLFILSQEGLVKKIVKQKKEHIPGHPPRFSLTYIIAKRKALAARIAPHLKEETAQDRMWFAIRKKRYFGLWDLVMLSGVKRTTVRWYLKELRGLGIIKPSRTGGGPGVEWMLINDVGPKRPYIKTRRKTKDVEAREKGVPETGTATKNIRVQMLVSKAEGQMLKNQALRLNLTTSAYLRMLINEAQGNQESSSFGL
jgi:predicted transcriptional regulator